MIAFVTRAGDFVDRGAWGLETLMLLLAYKWLLPQNVYLLRGNHEASWCTKVYGEVASRARTCNLKRFSSDHGTKLPWRCVLTPLSPFPITGFKEELICKYGTEGKVSHAKNMLSLTSLTSKL